MSTFPPDLNYPLSSVFFFPSTDFHPRACSGRQLPDVLCGIPAVQCHLRHLQQPHQSLLGDGRPALRPHFLPGLLPHTGRGASPKVRAGGAVSFLELPLSSISHSHSLRVRSLTPAGMLEAPVPEGGS